MRCESIFGKCAAGSGAIVTTGYSIKSATQPERHGGVFEPESTLADVILQRESIGGAGDPKSMIVCRLRLNANAMVQQISL